MYSLDKSGYKKRLLDFHKQISESQKIFADSAIQLKGNEIRNILYLGVGSSAIAGNILYDVLFDELTVPLDIVRSYFTPNFCNKNTLVIASSYSGNTEETVSSLKIAAEKGAQVVVITSGGKLAEMAKENSWGIISLPDGFQSRQTLGYLFFPVYHLLGDQGLLKTYDDNLDSLVSFVKKTSKQNDYPNADGPVLARELAQTIQNKIPVFYSTSPFLKSVSARWMNQVQENAKSLAFCNVLPEMNHNEIVGWELETEARKDFIAVFLENDSVHPRIKKRIELSIEIIKNHGVEVVDLYSSGESVLEKVFSLLILGDWMSYYLGIAYKKDPTEIKNIDYLKQKMALLNG